MSLSKLHVKSSETPIPQLELFSVQTTQMSLKSGRDIPYNGLDNSKKNNPIGGGGTIVFDMVQQIILGTLTTVVFTFK